jgi:hypothetical protein
MSVQNQIEKIKTLLAAKGKVNSAPANGEEGIAIKEQKLGKMYSVGIGVGKVVAFNTRFFDIQGYNFNEQFLKWEEGSIRIEPKAMSAAKGLSFVSATFAPGLIRKMDEAKWDKKLVTLDDLIRVLESL